jgi:hypothetical protein
MAATYSGNMYFIIKGPHEAAKQASGCAEGKRLLFMRFTSRAKSFAIMA